MGSDRLSASDFVQSFSRREGYVRCSRSNSELTPPPLQPHFPAAYDNVRILCLSQPYQKKQHRTTCSHVIMARVEMGCRWLHRFCPPAGLRSPRRAEPVDRTPSTVARGISDRRYWNHCCRCSLLYRRCRHATPRHPADRMLPQSLTALTARLPGAERRGQTKRASTSMVRGGSSLCHTTKRNTHIGRYSRPPQLALDVAVRATSRYGHVVSTRLQ